MLSIALGSESIRGGLLDANGTLHHSEKLSPLPGQLGLPPQRLLERVRKLANEIMAAGLGDPRLRVGGAVRMLGVNVAWPSPIDRRGYPRGHVLSENGWHSPRPGEPKRLSLGERVARVLGPPSPTRLAVRARSMMPTPTR